MSYRTVFGSLNEYEKGGVQVIDANPKHYVFSNVFDVASKSKAYERIAVAKNLRFVLEVTRADGVSPWFAASHDESALVMDGEVEIVLVKPERPLGGDAEGAVRLGDVAPKGKRMGVIKARRGHMALLPKGSAYQFRTLNPAVFLIQTIAGPETVQKWAEICQVA
jgi:hypothetical protein